MNGFVSRFVSLFFPPKCAFCGRIVPAGSNSCAECLASLPYVENHEKSGKSGRSHEFEKCAAPFYYEGPAKKGIWRLKFYKKTDGTAAFAGYMAKAVKTRFADITFDVIAFVPLSKNEMRQRGFNQSELLARALSKKIQIPAADVLKKPHDIKPQRRCSALERRGNVFGAFTVTDPDSIKGRTVLLVDDILTTGATLGECVKMLKLYGAQKVYCVVLAKVK